MLRAVGRSFCAAWLVVVAACAPSGSTLAQTRVCPNGTTVAAKDDCPAPEPPPTYCEVLDKSLARATKQAKLSHPAHCYDTPGINEAGSFGPKGQHDAMDLGSCFDDEETLEQVLHESDIGTLSFRYGASHELSAGGGLDLSVIQPWLPSLHAEDGTGGHASVDIELEDARYRTVRNLASSLQEQRNGQVCIERLCNDGYVYVSRSVLATVVVRIESDRARSMKLGASVIAAEFEVDRSASASDELVLRSREPLVVAGTVVPSGPLLASAGACDECGAIGQACCEGERCGGGTCHEGVCSGCGRADEPCCDGQGCEDGLACFEGECRTDCGQVGQPCCGGKTCVDGVECIAEEPPRVEERVLSTTADVSGGFFGTNENRVYGGDCGPSRVRSGRRVLKLQGEGGGCSRSWWVSADPHDCRVAVHYGVPGFEDVRCRIEVFATAPGNPDDAPTPTCEAD